MAVITEENGEISKGNFPEMRVKKYDNGSIFIVSPKGSTNKADNVVCAGPRKLAMLFSNDSDGDNVLINLYAFLSKHLSEQEFKKVQKAAMEFAKSFLP